MEKERKVSLKKEIKMKKRSWLLLFLFVALITGGCAAVKMNIVTEELLPQPKAKTVEIEYKEFDNAQNELIKTCSMQEVEFPIQGDYSDYQINWVKIHPTEHIVILELFAENRKKTREIFCINLDGFRNLWHLKLHEKGKVSVKDVVFLDNKGVVLLNDSDQIIALDLIGGNELWRIEEPKVDKLRYFEGTNRLLMLFSDKSLSMINSQTGETIWSSKLGKDYPGEPFLKGEDLFILSKGIKRYNLNNGLIWETEFDTYYKTGHLAGDIAKSVAVSILLAPLGYTYTQSTPPDFYYGCYSLPLVKESTLYIASLGQLRAINLENGETIWETEKIKDIENIQDFRIEGDRIYARYGGYSLKQTAGVYSYALKGAQGIMVLDSKTGEKIWQNDLYWEYDIKEKDVSPGIMECYIKKDKIILVTSHDIISLNKETGEILQKLPASELQVGYLVSAKEIDEGLLIKGKEGISLIDKESFGPIWSQAVLPAKSEFKFIPPEEVDTTFWQEQFLIDHYYRTFFEKFFGFNSEKGLLILPKEGDIVEIDVATGLIRYEFPMDTDNFYLDQNRDMLFLIQQNRLKVLQMKDLR